MNSSKICRFTRSLSRVGAKYHLYLISHTPTRIYIHIFLVNGANQCHKTEICNISSSVTLSNKKMITKSPEKYQAGKYPSTC